MNHWQINGGMTLMTSLGSHFNEFWWYQNMDRTPHHNYGLS
jgi:hypothetical protein